ncbi:hypothetical protein C5F52_12970 [Limnohabitans sp. TS-CS-82]|uniref:DUF6502 family protein n=1 Tax=Limnohabitans sp. TS-CS-82 TaxID=2094193 RepID=UPI000CF279CF|nr:DUF6502 family protein [Limnohabitans sp. TS-CS-82]PQA82519.1 hypothetical protein C5F52_12970 [Limnohabitans sp. TS-CS-82]
MNKTTPAPLHTEQQTLLAAMGHLLKPFAQLCLAKGVPIQAIEELVRHAYVDAAKQACDGGNPERLTSRISTMTGLTRREVARIQQTVTPKLPVTRSAANDLLTHWISHTDYVDKAHKPIAIPRQGPAPSFEALAANVTKDVHARSLLAEMIRLNLVTHRASTDTVELLEDIFVPNDNWPQMIGFLGTNVGEHLEAAVTNVLGDGHQHFEQALLADELSTESITQAKTLISAQWRSLITTLGPQLQALMDADKAANRVQDQAVRIGLYSFSKAMPSPDLSSDLPQ